MEYRIEHDSMGEVKVPADKLWGAQTQRSFQNFEIGDEKIPAEVITAFSYLKEAAALANCRLGVLDEKKAKLISTVCEEIRAGKLCGNFPLAVWQTGSGTQSNMNVNEVIANRGNEIAGEKLLHPNDDCNKSQSSNDTFPTAMHIAAVIAIEDGLFPAIDLLAATFRRLMAENDGIVKTGRTHLQDAVPITLGQEMGAYASAVRRSMRRIRYVLRHIHTINMGGTAVGTGLNAEPAYIKAVAKRLSEITGETYRTSQNIIDATNNTDAFADFSSALKNAALVLIKLANDFRLMASGPRCGLNELHLPMRQPGSSIMPGKVNPVIAEVLDQACYQVIAGDLAVTLAVENGQFELNVMEPIMAYNLFNSMNYLTNAVRTFVDKLLIGLAPNREQCRQWLDRSVGVVTALLPHIGYEQSAMLAKEAYTTGRPIREVILEKKLLTKEQLDHIMSPAQMTQPGITHE